MSEPLQKILIRNTLSNYLRTSVALVAGLLTFRLLFGYFSKEEFGMWALLWSLFGIGVLFDFGLGIAAQKRVAEFIRTKNWDNLSRTLSSILVLYTAIAIALPLLIIGSSGWWIDRIGLPEHQQSEYQLALGIFFAGVSLSFPLGIFPEILRGQQKIHLVNWLVIGSVILRVILIALSIHFHWSFTTLIIIAMASTLAPDFFSAFLAMRGLPKVKLSARYFSPRVLREISRFSFFAYLGILVNLLLSRADQLVITTTLGVGFIVLYQAGAKISEMFRDFTRQLQETLSPAAASLHAGKESKRLRGLMVEGNRWSALLATPLYLICAFNLRALITLLTGDPGLADETWLTGQILLFWYFTTILTHSVSRRVFMMTGHEWKLAWLGAAEAIANLTLSIGLVIMTQSVVGVAIGSLLPTLWFGWRHYWPWMAKEVGLSRREFSKATLLPASKIAIPSATLLTLIAMSPLTENTGTIPTLLISSLSITLLSTWLIWSFELTTEERGKIQSALANRLPVSVNAS